MGVVLKQSIQNTVVTYLGFFFGAINTLFLYTKILPDEYYGLVTFILASGAILMPLMAFGVHNTKGNLPLFLGGGRGPGLPESKP